jgi:hypothetical protein
MHDLLLQTAAFFDYSVIIEEGLSYRPFTEALGETPIIVHPDAALTINYLDTQGLPLTQLHLASAVALLTRMVGVPENEEHLALRSAQLTQYLHQLYRDAYVDWSRRRPEQSADAARLACAVHRWRLRMPAGTTPIDAFAEVRDRRGANDAEILSFIEEIGEADLTDFAHDPTTERLVIQTACALFSPEDHPTHGALVDLLAFARLPEHPKEEIDRLATLLRAWSADGTYGQLFDGITNVSLNRPVAHFELGFVPEQAVELKAATGLLISGFARQHDLAFPIAAETDHLRGGCSIPGCARRRKDRRRKLRAAPQVQLLGREHRAAVCPVQIVAGPARGDRQRQAVFSDAPVGSRRFGGSRRRSRAAGKRPRRDPALPAAGTAARCGKVFRPLLLRTHHPAAPVRHAAPHRTRQDRDQYPTMRTRLSTLSLVGLLFSAGCASTRKESPADATERADAAAAQARFAALQASQRAVPATDFELLPLARPERTEDGIIRTPSTEYIRIPRLP